MNKIKIDTETFRIISVFERITKVQPKDCLVSPDAIYFLIEDKKIGLAIGKNGVNTKKLSKLLGKEIRLFEYSESPEALVKNLIPSAENIEISGSIVKLTVPSQKRHSVIGRGGKNINMVKELLDRHCGIKELKIR